MNVAPAPIGMLPGLVIPENFFASILESSPDAMIVVDANGTICVVNAQNVASDEQSQASGCILLIEDDMQVADVLKNLFETAGNKICIASSKEEAIATLEHIGDVPDLIVSDYHLVGRATGVDAIGAIRELLGHNIPAFIVTADTSALLHDARTIGNCSIMKKPVDSDRILNMAAQAIQSGEATN